MCMRSFTNCHINTAFTCIKDYNLSTHNFPITHRGIRFALAPFLIIVISQPFQHRAEDEQQIGQFFLISFVRFFFSSRKSNRDYNISCFPEVSVCKRVNKFLFGSVRVQ